VVAGNACATRSPALRRRPLTVPIWQVVGVRQARVACLRALPNSPRRRRTLGVFAIITSVISPPSDIPVTKIRRRSLPRVRLLFVDHLLIDKRLPWPARIIRLLKPVKQLTSFFAVSCSRTPPRTEPAG